jgi:hypothetical protein
MPIGLATTMTPRTLVDVVDGTAARVRAIDPSIISDDDTASFACSNPRRFSEPGRND